MGMDVSVVREDGTLIDYYTFFPGMKVKDLLDVLKESRLNGFLRTGRSRSLPNMPAEAGATYVFVETEPKDEPWFLIHATAPTASYFANSITTMQKYLGTGDPLYDLGRASNGPPLVLTVEAFSEYAKHLKSHVLDSRDWDFVVRMMELSDFFDKEESRQQFFALNLEDYLVARHPSIQFRFQQSVKERTIQVDGKPNADIRVEAYISGEWIVVAIVEVKPEVGLGGEPCIEAVKYFADYTIAMRKMHHWSYSLSSCPMLIIEVVGPNIVRIGGAAHYLDKPAHQPFTPYLHILKFLQDDQHQELLSKALSSIPVAVCSLVQFYSKLKGQQVGRTDLKRASGLEWPYCINKMANEGASVIQQVLKADMGVGRLKKLVFYVQHQDQGKRIIKFCQKYGTEVHQLWANAGYAPKFDVTALGDGKWLMIDMEYFAEQDGWLPLSALDPELFIVGGDDGANKYRMKVEDWEVCKHKVLVAYQAVRLLDPRKVHGDIRRQNIMYNVSSTKVAFLDFEWSGTEGVDRYPLLLNNCINWAQGVTAAGLMATQHDTELLCKELRICEQCPLHAAIW